MVVKKLYNNEFLSQQFLSLKEYNDENVNKASQKISQRRFAGL